MEAHEIAAEIEKIRSSLAFYKDKAKSMGLAAIQSDNKGILKLMQEVAVDYGKKASDALSRLEKIEKSITALPPATAVDELVEALKCAKEVIQAWHGGDAWDIYEQHSPEMKPINQALSKVKGEK